MLLNNTTQAGVHVPYLISHPRRPPTLMIVMLGAAPMSISARGGPPARPALRPRASPLMVATSEPPPPGTSQAELLRTPEPTSLWDERELWALEDAVPRYAVDAGRLVCWDRLALDVPELITRSGEELRSCWFNPPTALQKGKLEDALAECPPRLEEWERLEDGSVRGVLYGVAGVRDGGIRATVPAIPAEVGCSMAEAEQWCARTPNPNPNPYPNSNPDPNSNPNPNPNPKPGPNQLGRQIETSEELALRIPDSLKVGEMPDLDSVGEAATAAVLSVRSPLVAVAAPAVALAVLVGGIMVATGGITAIPHIHIPHVDVSVFIV
eukprot:scaffold613_cov79-Phaeocystis_antarctica.AAC.8